MNEEYQKTFKEAPLPDDVRQNIINLLKEEGFTEEQIDHLSLIRQSFKNPRGLNEIMFEVAGCVINTDDWDANIHANTYIGKMTDYSANRKLREMWGNLLHEQAFRYLKENLENFGWEMKYGQIIDRREYDCIGWKGKIRQEDVALVFAAQMQKGFTSKQKRQFNAMLEKYPPAYQQFVDGVNQVQKNLTELSNLLQHPTLSTSEDIYKSTTKRTSVKQTWKT